MTSALLLGGVAGSLTLQQPLGAQTPQNSEPAMAAAAPRGAPMSFADLAARLQPAVVNISTTQRVQVSQGTNPFAGTPFADLFGGGDAQGGNGRPVTRQAQSLGSGFVISADGYVVTNNHVVAPGRQGAVVESITVTLPDRREYKARLVGRDLASDLAVLKIEAQNLPFVRFGDSTRTRVGDWVMAIGNPFGLGGTVTAGIVSALHRNTGQGGAYDRYIQTDASINMGNSGGPMFDLNGNVIGINTAIFSPSGGNVGIGFAIPAEQARPVVEALMRGGRVKRGYLGVQIQQITPDIAESLGLEKNRGELIASVEPDQAAARAGIRQGDVVVSVGGQPVTPDQTLSYLVSNSPIGSRIPLELIRDGRRQTVTVTVGERPPEEQLAQRLGGDNDNFADDDDGTSQRQAATGSLGLAVQPLTPGIARQVGVPAGTRGIVIGGVDPSSDAATKGLQRGDVITAANGRPVATAEELRAAVAEATRAGRSSVLLLVQRGNNPARYIGLRIKNG
nr:DegQ family serine endoprotease [Sphingomonas sp. ID1715]